ncbi:hypothetical protein HNY73_000692 [Argiope bruennichi]|uniref:PH domain-containing protein n=1 Tax=Argiope bruennichi TaxID=94029 RepID=A0A8T0FYX1_ARGBR|nr:hypothetical protein HNY73_000692 [Argiope bruennichi]
MADPQTVIEGTLKYRDNKKWKPRWCVIRKLSPVAGNMSFRFKEFDSVAETDSFKVDEAYYIEESVLFCIINF